MFDDVVALVHELDEENTETREVFATVESVGQSEFFAAAQTGLKSELKVTLRQSDYDGEQIVDLDGHSYDIYRTFIRMDGKIELYLGQKIGV
ncbi:MAG TPA: phage head-tail adapter protein [Clostridiales bacterium]|jgi:SPP1 family predicted phage head-tail adaptor|nr:phage head-tail adapter protein [Clostridiales bacterium]HBL82037.1 phage head-tail adapter protein [Clostridiales bacterium]